MATGNTEYYPFYLSHGLMHNNIRRAHVNGVSLAAFLAIPKSVLSLLVAVVLSHTNKIHLIADKQYSGSLKFRVFRRQLFHSSINHILQSLRPAMKTPVIRRCADGHFRRIIYGLGPSIADYPEQALLGCIVQGWCPR